MWATTELVRSVFFSISANRGVFPLGLVHIVFKISNTEEEIWYKSPELDIFWLFWLFSGYLWK